MGQRCRFGIIADDLTGATDAAVPFAQRGFATAVALRRHDLAGLQAEIVALTTNSRHDPPAVARRKVRAACQLLRRQGVGLLYKKLDSTVQGNIVAEAEAARDTAGFQTVLFCPANPAQGRVVGHGLLKVRGQPFAQLHEHLANQGLRQFSVLDAPVTLPKAAELLRHAPRFVIADAQSEPDLAILVQAALDAPRPVLLAGSAGMAGQLAKLLGPAGRVSRPALVPSNSPIPTDADLLGPPLVFCGSNNPVTQRQIAALLRRPGTVDAPLTRRTAKAITAALCSGYPAVVRVPIHLRPDHILLERLALISALLCERRIGSLILTGGDTGLLVCRWLRPQGLVLRGELLPGLPWGTIIGGRADGMVVCTKPGGFGKDDSLVEAVRLLSARKLSP
jgi:D-threonate/D-erythronate kinase